MAGLPASGNIVCVGPPLLASASSIGSLAFVGAPLCVAVAPALLAAFWLAPTMLLPTHVSVATLPGLDGCVPATTLFTTSLLPAPPLATVPLMMLLAMVSAARLAEPFSILLP